MVSRNPRQKKLPSSVQFASIAVLALFVIVSLSSQEASISGDLYSSPAIERQQSMIKWRELAQEECKELIKTVGKKADSAGVDKKEALERAFVNKIKMNPEPSTISASKTEPYRRCKNAFIDLGTNIGDSIGYFIDNSVDVCSLMWVDANPDTKFDNKFPRPHLDVATLEFKHRGSKPNPLYGLLQRTMKKSPQATSETFCVYGMEGNPVFTERLTKLENFVSDMNPRPVQHLHIFTESVVTATNGPTKLFLDKLSEKHNVSTRFRKTSPESCVCFIDVSKSSVFLFNNNFTDSFGDQVFYPVSRMLSNLEKNSMAEMFSVPM